MKKRMVIAMKQIDLCICETGSGLALAQAKHFVVFPENEVILDDNSRVAVVNVLPVEENSDTFEFIFKLSKQTTLPRVIKVVHYEEV